MNTASGTNPQDDQAPTISGTLALIRVVVKTIVGRRAADTAVGPIQRFSRRASSALPAASTLAIVTGSPPFRLLESAAAMNA